MTRLLRPIAGLASALRGRLGGRQHRAGDDRPGSGGSGPAAYPGEPVVPQPPGYRDRKASARRSSQTDR